MSSIYEWCEERLKVQSIADDILSKFVPAHVNIFYCFGGIVLTCFLFQGGTGFALTIYYRPTVVEAFISVRLILYTIHLGWFVRSIHRWSSGTMVLVLILHVMRVYLTGGFSVSQTTLTRLYSIHTFVLPFITLSLLILHLSMLRK